MANQTLNSKVTLRNDTAANWSTVNPVLLRGEFGYEIDTRKFKLGDGTTAWNSLSYASAMPSVVSGANPQTTDNSYDVGTVWINTTAQTIWVLTKLSSGTATWLQVIDSAMLADLGAGDMLASTYAPTAQGQSKTGYVDKALQADKLTTGRNIAISGDASGTATDFDGSANATISLTLATILASPGTATKVTVNGKGLVTAVSNLDADDIPSLLAAKITDLGTAATLNTGKSAGNIVVVETDGYIDDSLIPKIAITDTFEAASEAAMLALSSAEKGDIAIRSDINKCFILAVDGYATLANWKELKTPTDAVLSVNTKTGAVSLTADDIPEAGTPTNKYYTAARFAADFATAIAVTASTSLSDGASILKNTDVLILNCGYADGYTQS